MAFVKRIGWSMLILSLAVSVGFAAGSNAGGTMIVHAADDLTYTIDTTTYNGQSGVACGQDGPAPPYVPVCPPYDPPEGLPCSQTAADPTSAKGAGDTFIWFVLAAFPIPQNPDEACPRLKSLNFTIDYDETSLSIVAYGPAGIEDLANGIFEVPRVSFEDSRAWPAPKSNNGMSYSVTRTSPLQEIYWFAGYIYGEGTFTMLPEYPGDPPVFVDDAVPSNSDFPTAFGILGFGGATGENFLPVTPVDETSWGQIKAHYSGRN